MLGEPQQAKHLLQRNGINRKMCILVLLLCCCDKVQWPNAAHRRQFILAHSFRGRESLMAGRRGSKTTSQPHRQHRGRIASGHPSSVTYFFQPFSSKFHSLPKQLPTGDWVLSSCTYRGWLSLKVPETLDSALGLSSTIDFALYLFEYKELTLLLQLLEPLSVKWGKNDLWGSSGDYIMKATCTVCALEQQSTVAIASLRLCVEDLLNSLFRMKPVVTSEQSSFACDVRQKAQKPFFF